jgi:hypothetical protein
VAKVPRACAVARGTDANRQEPFGLTIVRPAHQNLFQKLFRISETFQKLFSFLFLKK